MAKHNFYEPTEYEQMLLAAGWVTMADLDTEYMQYLKNTPYREFTCTYDQWRANVIELDTLAEQWDCEIAPLLTEGCYLEYEQKRRMDNLSRAMSNLEFFLGY